MSNLFDMILERDGLRFSDFLDDDGKDEIRSFWDDIVGDRGSVTDAEIDSVLSTYKGLGVIVPADGISSDQEKELKVLDRTWEAGARGHKPTRSSIAHWLNGGYDRPSIEDTEEAGELVNDFKKGLVDKTSDIVGAGKEALRSVNDKADDLLEALTQSIQTSSAAGKDKKAGAALTGAKAVPTENRTQPEEAGSHASASPDPTIPQIPKSAGSKGEVSYQLLYQTNRQADERHPIMILSDPMKRIPHHQVGAFTDPSRQTAFEMVYEGSACSVKILQLDRRFVNLLFWLGTGHIAVRLSGRHFTASQETPLRDRHGMAHVSGYAVYKITAVDLNANSILQTANNDFLQLVIRRMLASNPKEALPKEAAEEMDLSDQTMLMTDMPAMTDYINCAQDALPSNILNWARRQIAMVKSESVSAEEQKHAQRALSIMLNIQWQGSYFPPIDPTEARQILDEELYGMEQVKQRIVETIIQINRTHTLPAYGLLLIGPAGTGKTYLAMAQAVRRLLSGEVRRIVLTRPAVEAGENLGFLPGSLTDKIDPYLRPLYDALGDMLDPEALPKLMAAGTIEVAPLAYMRGRTLNDSFIILDEAQNTTVGQMKMFLTRLGFGSKVVVTGDASQVDLPGSQTSGLSVVENILGDIDDIEFCHLTSADVVRHELVGAIIDAYQRFDDRNAARRARTRSHNTARREYTS